MKKNIGTVDRIIRLILVLVIAALFFTNVISGTLAIILGIMALALVVTSFMSFCGLYTILGINTCKKPAQDTSR